MERDGEGRMRILGVASAYVGAVPLVIAAFAVAIVAMRGMR